MVWKDAYKLSMWAGKTFNVYLYTSDFLIIECITDSKIMSIKKKRTERKECWSLCGIGREHELDNPMSTFWCLARMPNELKCKKASKLDASGYWFIPPPPATPQGHWLLCFLAQKKLETIPFYVIMIASWQNQTTTGHLGIYAGLTIITLLTVSERDNEETSHGQQIIITMPIKAWLPPYIIQVGYTFSKALTFKALQRLQIKTKTANDVHKYHNNFADLTKSMLSSSNLYFLSHSVCNWESVTLI